jgi:hypothetical protein
MSHPAHPKAPKPSFGIPSNFPIYISPRRTKILKIKPGILRENTGENLAGLVRFFLYMK